MSFSWKRKKKIKLKLKLWIKKWEKKYILKQSEWERQKNKENGKHGTAI